MSNPPLKPKSKKIDWKFIIAFVLIATCATLFPLLQSKFQKEKNQKYIVKEYIDNILSVGFDKDLTNIENKKQENDEITSSTNAKLVTRTLTLTALRRLDDDGKSKGVIIRFLHEATLIILNPDNKNREQGTPNSDNQNEEQGTPNSDNLGYKLPCITPHTSINLCGANLNNIKLQNAWLWRVNLIGTFLSNADFSNANLKEANFKTATLSDANFNNAILSYANLQGANLQGANLQGADLQGADLQGAKLTQAKMKNALYTNSKTTSKTCDRIAPTIYFTKSPQIKHPCPTIFPSDFNPETAGMKLSQ